MASDIILTVDKHRQAADAARFFAAGSHLLELLDDLADTPEVVWRVSDLRMGSAVTALAAEGDQRAAGVTAARSAVGGLIAIRGGEELPTDWTPIAVGHAKELVRRVDENTTLECDNTVVQLDRYLRDRLDAATPWVREFHGSIRGQLTGVNVTRGNRASIKPQGGGRVVHVGFPTTLSEQMKAGFLQFVEIDGLVRQNDEGRNYYVSAEEVHVLGETVPWLDLYGLIPEITGGFSVSDYLEDIRGAE